MKAPSLHLLLVVTLALLGGVLPLAVYGQTPEATPTIKIVMIDGRVQPASALHRKDNALFANIATASGGIIEMGFPIEKIQRIELPYPRSLDTTKELMATGKFSEALSLIDPVVIAQSDLRQIEGNYWNEALLLKISALIALKREKEALPLLDEIIEESKNPNDVILAKLTQASLWNREGRTKEAMAVDDEAIAKNSDPSVLAKAWFGKGECQLTLKDYDGSIVAFLRIPVFYSGESSLQAPSLMGTATAFKGLNRLEDSQETYKRIMKEFPDSPEATVAAAELETLKKASPSPAKP